MSGYKVTDVFEQEATFDSKFSLAVDRYLLMKIINHMAADDSDDVVDMKDPKRIAVRVIIETKELPVRE